MMAMALAGCSEIRLEAGVLPGAPLQAASARASKRPDMNVLEGTLKLGASTKQEVMAALGRPTGDGGIFLPIDQGRRETWSYYYEETTMPFDRSRWSQTESRRLFLFVYFAGDRYDGYMWFSSLR